MKVNCLIILCLLFTGCTEKKVEIKQNITETQKEFTYEINEIFGKVNPKNMKYYNSTGAEYVIFKIKSDDMDVANYLDIEKNKIKDKKWIYLDKQGASIIYCRNNNQLEISIPKNILRNIELEDGDILRQNENEWNITLYKSKKIKTLCSTQE
ncbi:hypothetical protein [Acinetobacter bereziniae]|uniref:hypothetical protein n=2 Tax=Acinetobacter bereziniae TaxID=106648 RepID=UPI0018FF3178|nr:hypothetical protein [Acinetobacter bereziniae]MBJ9903939.1 hypothetical protein [Acinetobacter bereziniae]MCU4319977.1 hypothetical protein [Acinetobacter bereziniae]MCU4600711.1 hypothetical protein [Acinetobacter bereziniae]